MKAEQIERLEFAIGRADLLSSALGDCVVRIDRETARALLQLARAVQQGKRGCADPADIIAGALGVSRGYAYGLMCDAVARRDE